MVSKGRIIKAGFIEHGILISFPTSVAETEGNGVNFTKPSGKFSRHGGHGQRMNGWMGGWRGLMKEEGTAAQGFPNLDKVGTS